MAPTKQFTETDDAHVLRCQQRAKVLFTEGCFQGDIARAPLSELTELDREVLNGINETLLSLTHRGLTAEDVIATAATR